MTESIIFKQNENGIWEYIYPLKKNNYLPKILWNLFFSSFLIYLNLFLCRQSPSRGNHTDSELLSSPSQVLYATISADKHSSSRDHKNNLAAHTLRNNQHMAHSASQTVHSGFRPLTIDRQVDLVFVDSNFF